MAVPVLDLSVLEYFKPIFSALFIFTLFYAVLLKVKIFGDNKAVSLLISLGMTALTMFYVYTSEIVELFVPWFFITILLVVGIMVIFLFMGVSPEAIVKAVGSEKGYVWTIVIILIVFILMGFSVVFEKDVSADKEEQAQGGNLIQDAGEVIFNPKALGVFILFFIMGLGIKALTTKT